MNRTNISSKNPWENIVGYSRAVKIGNYICVAGTIATDEDGKIVGKDNPEKQTEYIFQKIEKALQQVGASFQDVIRTRIFVTNIDYWENIGKVHGRIFQKIRPTCTMVEVSRLIIPEALVEIEVDAIVK